MQRREFLQTLAFSSASIVLASSLRGAQSVLTPGHNVYLKCLGNVEGPRFLDGRTANATVGLAPKLSKQFSGTKWGVVNGGAEGRISLHCLGTVNGNRWLDGRTRDGSVGLAPNRNKPFTGVVWEVVPLDQQNSNIIALKCLGDGEGPRWLDGRTGNGSVGLAESTHPPFTGTHWEVRAYPVCIDSPCDLP